MYFDLAKIHVTLLGKNLILKMHAQDFPGDTVDRILWPVEGTWIRSLAREDPIWHMAWPPKQTTTKNTHIKICTLDKHKHPQVTGRRALFHLSRSAVWILVSADSFLSTRYLFC